MIESHGIAVIRTNPDAADFDMNKLKTKYISTSVNQIKTIEKSRNKKTKKQNKRTRKQNKFVKTKQICKRIIKLYV